MTRFNAWLAEKVTNAVGTMWAAYAFAVLAICGFPGLLGPKALTYVLWTSTIFLQLVLLSVLANGQTLADKKRDIAGEKLARHGKMLAEIHEHLGLRKHG